MSEVIVVEDRVDLQCVRHVHLISNIEIGRNVLRPYGAPNGIATREAGAWHLRADYPHRGVLDIQAACRPEKFRRLVVWSLEGCGSVREAISQAYIYFWVTFKFSPAYVFMRKLPSAVEHGDDFEDLVLLEAEWMLERCIAVGGRK